MLVKQGREEQLLAPFGDVSPWHGWRLILPAGKKPYPSLMCPQIVAEEIIRTGFGFFGSMQQMHIRFAKGASTLASVAGGTCTDQIVPTMLAAKVARYYMVNCQIFHLLATVLAGVVVPSENLLFAESDVGTGTVDHVLEADDRRAQDELSWGSYIATPIFHYLGLADNDQDDCATGTAHINGLIVGV